MAETIKTYRGGNVAVSQCLVTIEVFIGDVDNYDTEDDGTFDVGDAVTAVNGLIWSMEQREAEFEGQRGAIARLMTCGNHVALYRKDNWPGYVLGGLTREQQCEHALRTLGATQAYDLWCCWSGMMQVRDELAALSSQNKPQ